MGDTLTNPEEGKGKHKMVKKKNSWSRERKV